MFRSWIWMISKEIWSNPYISNVESPYLCFRKTGVTAIRKFAFNYSHIPLKICFMKRLFNLILAVALISISFVSCTERSYIQFNQTSKSCDASAQVVTLDTNMPIQFIGVRTNNDTNYIDCQYLGNSLECDGGWFTATSSKNGNQVVISLNENSSSSNREIKVQAIYNGVATTCTLVQSGK